MAERKKEMSLFSRKTQPNLLSPAQTQILDQLIQAQSHDRKVSSGSIQDSLENILSDFGFGLDRRTLRGTTDDADQAGAELASRLEVFAFVLTREDLKPSVKATFGFYITVMGILFYAPVELVEQAYEAWLHNRQNEDIFSIFDVESRMWERFETYLSVVPYDDAQSLISSMREITTEVGNQSETEALNTFFEKLKIEELKDMLQKPQPSSWPEPIEDSETEETIDEISTLVQPDGPRFCVNCGSALKAGAKFCGSCGSPIS